ncbi:MAG: asparagine synthase (glutamine-hydrolyzing) [Blastopirellula sp.]|nr:MAG: asparagine synthase (glutamine-hydrolyzing) [Blastopirellula sp.]
MCGIAGCRWNTVSALVDQGTLDRMTDSLQHRGPDDRGTYLKHYDNGGGIALGHRRLSIIDLAGGRQPIPNEDETVWITFNGEIYNYVELRQELISKGHKFRTNSDTETIVHLYEEEGIECLQRLRGMFAFALWDAKKQTLFMARDRLGQKPLVYCQQKDRLLFGSEVKAILQAPGVDREVDKEAIDLYLTYGYVPHDKTMFAGINKLPPGCYAVYSQDKLTVKRYWNPDFDTENSDDLTTIRERLKEKLDDAVRLRLRSDVPLGAFLSGGIDSTVIVGLMQDNLPHPTKTFTIGFPIAGYDESGFAKEAADHLKTEHHSFQVESDFIENVNSKLAWYFDEPFADSSSIPTYLVSQITSQHVKVAMTGDGGDELFCGYDRYSTFHKLGAFDAIPASIRSVIGSKFWGNLLPDVNRESSILRRLLFRMQSIGQSVDRRYANWITHFHQKQKQALYHKDYFSLTTEFTPEEFVAGPIRNSKSRPTGTRAMHADLQTYLPCDLLTKVDITSMANGLECRSPFLDHHVVEYALSIPFHQQCKGTSVKPMLSETFAKYFPPKLQNRPKMGFRVPLDDWFRGPLREFARDIILDPQAIDRGYFQRQSLETMLEDHISGRWNHGDRIWSLVCLELWHKRFIDAEMIPVSVEEHQPVSAIS